MVSVVNHTGMGIHCCISQNEPSSFQLHPTILEARIEGDEVSVAMSHAV